MKIQNNLKVNLILLFLLLTIIVKAQATCNGTASISPNGTTTINSVAVTSASTGAVAQYASAFNGDCATLSPNSLRVGKHATASDGNTYTI